MVIGQLSPINIITLAFSLNPSFTGFSNSHTAFASGMNISTDSNGTDILSSSVRSMSYLNSTFSILTLKQLDGQAIALNFF
jgi:hypothetical protein